ncbi:MAG: OmpA family protein [Hyphomicrobiaceae bacterium]
MIGDRSEAFVLAACLGALIAASPALAEPAATATEGTIRLAQATQPNNDPNDPNARRRRQQQGGPQQGGQQQGPRRGQRGAPPAGGPRPAVQQPKVQIPAATRPTIGAPAQPRVISRTPQVATPPNTGRTPPFNPRAARPIIPQATPRAATRGGQPIARPAAPPAPREFPSTATRQPPQIGAPRTGPRQAAPNLQQPPRIRQLPGQRLPRAVTGRRPIGPGGPAVGPGRPPGVVPLARRDNRWRNRAIVGGAVVGGAAILGAIALDKARAEAAERRRERHQSFDDIRGGRREFTRDGQRLIVEPDRRRIIRTDRGLSIRYDEGEWLRRAYGERGIVTRRRDGTITTVIRRPGGIEIVSITDGDGRLLRRVRRYRDGREVVLIDAGRRFWPGRGYRVPVYAFLDIAPPVVRIPRSRYIVEYRDASVEDIFEALSAPPVAELDRGYALDEIRDTYALRQYMPRVDLDLLTFDFGRYEITPDQYDRLDRVARALRRILEQSPDEVFMVEGHTDAVGSKEDNISLSDRRAEEVARVLIEGYGIPAENLVTQGYGEQFLKVRTDGPERANRRVAVLRITPLLERGDGDEREVGRNDERGDDRDDRRPPAGRDDEDDDQRPRGSGTLGTRRF